MRIERTWKEQQDGSMEYRMSATFAPGVEFVASCRASRQEMRQGYILPPVEQHLRAMILEAIRRELFQ